MSLVAYTSNYSHGIMIGDILISSEEVNASIKIPTFLGPVDKYLPENQNFFPYSLRQKIYVLNDMLIIALAGFVYSMKFFLESIKDHFKYKSDCTIDELDLFIKEYDFSQIEECSACIVLAEKTSEGVLMQSRYIGEWQETQSATFESITCCGTGALDFLKYSREKMSYRYDGRISRTENAITLNYILICRLLGNEKLSLETIKNYWGAGFELIYFNGEKFTKMDNITFVIWSGVVDLKTKQAEIFPVLILNFKYFGDILFITATNSKQVEGYAVLPIYMNKNEVDSSKFPKRADFDSDKVCCTYILELSNGKSYTPSFYVSNAGQRPGGISINFNEEGQLQVLVQEAIHNQIFSTIYKMAESGSQ